MPDLERELHALGAEVDFPATPDLVAAVRSRIATAPRARAFWWRRPLVVALATLIVAIGAVMAVPAARTAVLEWLGLRGVAIEHVPKQRPIAPGGDLALGERLTLAQARQDVDFRVRVPRELGAPDAVYFSAAYASGGYVALVYGSGANVNLLVTQFRARIDEGFIQKLIAPGTMVERTNVRGASIAFWIEGAPHEIFYVDDQRRVIPDTARLAGNTLLWQVGGVTYRVEGAATLEDAVRIARSMS